MLDDNLKAQLKAYLERVTLPFEIEASLSDSASSAELKQLLQDIAAMSDKITLRLDGNDARKPSFSLKRTGTEQSLRFAGIPLGHEFTSLVLALLWTGGHPPKVEQSVIDQIQGLDGDYAFEVYMSLTCHNCPDVVQALSLMSVLNPRIKTVIVDGALFQDEVNAREIMAVPTVYLNGQEFGSGRMTVEEIAAKLDTGAAAKDAAKLSAKDPYDVLIVGGGPAVPRRRCTPPARASVPVSRPSASAARSTTRWRSKTTSPCCRPTARSSRWRWSRTSRITAST